MPHVPRGEGRGGGWGFPVTSALKAHAPCTSENGVWDFDYRPPKRAGRLIGVRLQLKKVGVLLCLFLVQFCCEPQYCISFFPIFI